MRRDSMAGACSEATSPVFTECPRPELNQRTRFRKPLLYPLSYGGSTPERSAAVARLGSGESLIWQASRLVFLDGH